MRIYTVGEQYSTYNCLKRLTYHLSLFLSPNKHLETARGDHVNKHIFYCGRPLRNQHCSLLTYTFPFLLIKLCFFVYASSSSRRSISLMSQKIKSLTSRSSMWSNANKFPRDVKIAENLAPAVTKYAVVLRTSYFLV